MGMGQTGCCCGVKKGTCSTCNPEHSICCLQVEHSGWVANAPILLRPSATGLWDTGDTCTGINATEICGVVEDHWHMSWREEGCLPRISLSWRPIAEDCDRIALTLKLRWQDYTGAPVMSETTIEEDRNWYVRDIEFTDPLYSALHSVDPVAFPEATYTIKIRECPEGYTEFPNPQANVVLQGVMQRKNSETGEWSDSSDGGQPFWVSCGNCVCGSPAIGNTFWMYDPYKDKVRIFSNHGTFPSVLVPYEDCAWPDTEIFSYFPGLTPDDPPTFRVRIQRLDIECPTGSIDPAPPPLYCKKATLCVMLSVPDEGETDYLLAPVSLFYNLIWNGTTEQYELGPVSVPGDKPYTIELTLVEDSGSLPSGSPVGSRAWVLTVTIKGVPSGVTVFEESYVLVLDCTEEWSWEDVLEVPIDPTEDWLLHIGTSCPSPPEPPSCDPGCWPECVMCPTRKTLYAVVSDAPDCCLSGTYALTWVGTGGYGAPTVGYYELPAPVGGPIDTCGQITFLRVSCVDSTHIMVQLVYLRAEGTEISNLSSPDTLSVICDGSGHLESDAIHVPGRSGGRESLCGFGSGVGGDIRIVSA